MFDLKNRSNRLLSVSLHLVFTFGFCANAALSTEKQFDPNKQSLFKSDVEGLSELMLSPSYWQDKLDPDQSIILSQQQITSQNDALFRSNQHMNDLNNFAERLNKHEIINRIAKSSKIPSSNRYYSNGKQVSAKDFSRYKAALNTKNITDEVKVRYGMAVKRTNLRSFPTSDAVFKTFNNTNLDRFQETALFPAEAVVILHQSSDHNWFYVVSYNYSGWAKTSDIAIGDKKEIFRYKNDKLFLLVTGDKVFTTYNPIRKNVSYIQLDMGTKISLLSKALIPASIDGQNTYSSHVVKFPTRTQEGKLAFELALISRNKDVRLGYLPFTRRNIIQQSFKFLGERYGWGHSFNARDCTGFVGEIYKSFGILMPRNTGQQAQSNQGQNIHFTQSTSIQQKIAEITSLEVGDLIYIPGHVMMFIGLENNKPFVIHDVSGFSYIKRDGSFYKSVLNGVSVTPLLPLQLNQESSYLDRVYNLKKIK